MSQNISLGLKLVKVICTSDALYLHYVVAATYLWGYSSEPLTEPTDFFQFGYELPYKSK